MPNPPSQRPPSQRPSARPSSRPSSRPSTRPSFRPTAHESVRPSFAAPPYEPPARSIKPSEPRNRAILAGVCAAIFGTFVISAVVRTCSGEDFWEKPNQSAPAPAQRQPPQRQPSIQPAPPDAK